MVRRVGLVLALVLGPALGPGLALGCGGGTPSTAPTPTPTPTTVEPAPAPPTTSPAASPAPDGDVDPMLPESAGDACRRDDECLVTNFPGCCACPQCSTSDPVARSRAAQARAEAACAAASCDMAICGVAGMCPPGEDAAHFVARCRGGVCVGERR